MDTQLPSYLKPIDKVLASPGKPSDTSPSLIQSTSDKLRLMLVSTHAHQYTGYSKISYGILQELSKDPSLDLIHFGFQKHPQISSDFRPYPSTIDVIDAAALETPSEQGFGYKYLIDIVKKKNPHIIMIYNDMAVVTRFLEEIRKVALTPRPFKIWVYCDQVYDSQHQGMIDIMNRDIDRIFTFTSYWKKQLKEQGVTRPLSVLGHGFDSKTFFTVPRNLARKSLKLPEEAFVIMSLNRNQPRKRYDIMLMAFVELIIKNPSKPIILLCICDKGERGGWWLFELFVRELKKKNASIEQFGNRLMISSQDMAFKDEDVNILYNIADIGISTADGEGWGLCTFEQMGVGIPQVVPDLGGYKEYCSQENSMIVEPKHRYYLPSIYSPVGGEAHVCDPHDVYLAMEEYLNNPEKRQTHGQKAKETVLTYTWERAVKELVSNLKIEHLDLQ
jgi:glycosyltransferase involved in cell wall biosynthesis